MDKSLIEKLDEAASHIKVGPKPSVPSSTTVMPEAAKVDVPAARKNAPKRQKTERLRLA